jgi:hypothetical protein
VKRLWRAPLLHFLAAGLALFAAERVGRAPAAADRVVDVSRGDVLRLTAEARRELGREPHPDELERRVAAQVDEELLISEARALGWHETDPVVRLRLVQNLRFVSPEGVEAEAEALLERAFALGMDRTDVVVRRRLAERMRLAIAAAATRDPPPEAELEAILAREPERFRRPPLVQLTHVYLSRDRRGAALERDARALRAELHAAGASPDTAARRGDPFLWPAHLPLSSERALAARFGPDFAAAAIQLAPERWSEPIASSYGLHLVWVHRRLDARLPPLAEVRSEVVAHWRQQREAEALAQALAALRRDARVRVAAGPEPAAPGG